MDSGTLVGTLDYGTLRVATATMGYKHFPLEHDKAEAEVRTPTFMLKVLRGYTGEPRICELVRTPVREIVSVSHILTDLSLTPAAIVHDYLAGAEATDAKSA